MVDIIIQTTNTPCSKEILQSETNKDTDLLPLLEFSPASSASLLLALALLQEGLGNEDLVLGGDGAVGRKRIEGQLQSVRIKQWHTQIAERKELQHIAPHSRTEGGHSTE